MKRSLPYSIPDLIKTFLTGWLLLAVLMLSIPMLYPDRSEKPLASASSEPTASSDFISEEPSASEPAAESEQPTIQTTESEKTSSGDPVSTLVYYNQKDPVWSSLSYGEDDIGGYGCGPTACAIMISTLTGETVTPKDMAEWSVDNGCYINGGGSYHNLIPLACKSYGLTVDGCTAADRKKILTALQSGALVGVIMGPGDFTSTGHFIVLYGLNDAGKIWVADPASTENTKAWDPEIIFSQARSYAASGGPFWIVTK